MNNIYIFVGVYGVNGVQSHIERELRQLHSLQWNVFFYSNGGSWSLSKVPGSSSKHMQRHRDAAEQTVCDALLKG